MSFNSIIFQYAAIGDYLFLIMIVLASIIQTISQNRKKKVLEELSQKKKEQSNNHSNDVLERKPEIMSGYDTPKESIFDSIQKMLIPEFEEEEDKWEGDYSEPVEEIKVAKEITHGMGNSEEKLMRDIEKRHAELIAPKPVTETQAVRYKSRIRDGFSLRKAVIYSEILNRKYT